MLPAFPQFKKIDLSDKADIENITSQFPPYSDFNFLSMWVWNIQEAMRISEHNGNLVVMFTDYLTGEPFYSFLGNNKVNETVEDLLELSKKEKIEPVLKLMPEDSIKNLDKNKFEIKEERNHFDYIYPIEKIQSYVGSRHKKHRESTRFFARNYNFEAKQLDLTDKANHKLLVDLIDLWVKNKKEKAGTNNNDFDLDDFYNEYLALKKLFTAPASLLKSVVCFSVFVDGKLSAFMIDEKVSKDYCISHFGKIDKSHRGNLQLLMQNSAKMFFDLGVNYYNDEQDLGRENLRSAKSSYELAHFLKKYTVSLR